MLVLNDGLRRRDMLRFFVSDTAGTPVVHLEKLCLEQCVHGLPQQEQTDEEWLGIGFPAGKTAPGCAASGEVAEIINPA